VYLSNIYQMNMKIRFRNFLKRIGLIQKDKLEKLENISKDVKRLIQEHNQYDPTNPDFNLNTTLYMNMYQTLDTIERIKKNNPNLDWNK